MDGAVLFSLVWILTLQGNSNQIADLIETMDKLTKEGEHLIATETLKACSGTFSCGLKIILHFLQYWKCLLKRALPRQIELFRAATVVLCIKQPRFYAWLRLTDVRRIPAVVAIKSFQ